MSTNNNGLTPEEQKAQALLLEVAKKIEGIDKNINELLPDSGPEPRPNGFVPPRPPGTLAWKKSYFLQQQKNLGTELDKDLLAIKVEATPEIAFKIGQTQELWKKDPIKFRQDWKDSIPKDLTPEQDRFNAMLNKDKDIDPEPPKNGSKKPTPKPEKETPDMPKAGYIFNPLTIKFSSLLNYESYKQEKDMPMEKDTKEKETGVEIDMDI